MKTIPIGQRVLTILGAIATVAVASAQHTHGAIIIDMTESAGNVQAVLNGSANITDLSLVTNWGDSSLALDSLYGSQLWVGSGSGNFQEWKGAGMSGPNSFGVGSDTLTFANSGTGPLAGIRVDIFSVGIAVPTGYVSGSTLSSSSTWNGKTIADLGLAPGTYTWTWGVGTPNADSLTLNIVPEPASLTLGSLCLLGIIGRRRMHQ